VRTQCVAKYPTYGVAGHCILCIWCQ